MKILAALALFVGIFLLGALIALKSAADSANQAEFRRRVRRWREVRNRKPARRAQARAAAARPSPPSPQFAASAAFVHLAVLVCTADEAISPEERALLADHIARAPVSKAEREKLREQLAKMLAEPPTFWGTKKRLSLLDVGQQATIADLLIGVAGVDGHVGPDEIRMLGRIYPMLGLPAADVYSRVHALSVGEQAEAEAPVAAGAPVQLNMAAVQAKLAQSAEVSALLGDIFAEEEEQEQQAQEVRAKAPIVPPAPVSWSSSPHGMLLARLVERPVWTREEFDTVAAELRLLPDGAIDALNEAAFDRAGGPVLEGDDPIHVDMTTAKALLP
jgi:tellurite resistance protein